MFHSTDGAIIIYVAYSVNQCVQMTGLSTAILLFSGHKNYKISGHFQDTKTMLSS